MKNVKEIASRPGQSATAVGTSNIRLFPTGKNVTAETARQVAADYQPQSLSDGFRVFVLAEFRERPFSMIAALICLLVIFFLIFVGIPAIFG